MTTNVKLLVMLIIGYAIGLFFPNSGNFDNFFFSSILLGVTIFVAWKPERLETHLHKPYLSVINKSYNDKL